MESTLPHIAFMTTVYDQTDVGGGTFVRYLRRAADRGLLNITFYSDDIRTPQASYERKVNMPSSVQRLPGGWLTRAWYYWKALQLDYETRPFDVIWHNNAITGVFGPAANGSVPVVGMINDYNNAESRTPFSTQEIFGRSRALIRYGWHHVEGYAARTADCLIVNSSFMADRIRKAYGVDGSRIALLYKGVDLDMFSYVERPLPAGRPVRLLFVKRDYLTGGLPDLLAALSNFPRQVALTVVGPPLDRHGSIRAMAEGLGVHDVRLLGPMSREEMPRCFLDHDVLCIPSRSEALGVSLMEALASGTPAVGSAVGGVPEVLDSGRAGWLVEPHNPHMLRETLLMVIDHDGERAQKVRHGQAHVARFSHANMIDRMSRIARAVRDNQLKEFHEAS